MRPDTRRRNDGRSSCCHATITVQQYRGVPAECCQRCSQVVTGGAHLVATDQPINYPLTEADHHSRATVDQVWHEAVHVKQTATFGSPEWHVAHDAEVEAFHRMLETTEGR